VRLFIKCLFLFILISTIGAVFAMYLEAKNQLVSQIYNEVRPKVIRGGGPKCLSELVDKKIKFKSLGDVQDGQCLIKNAIKITDIPNVRFANSITLNCKTAVNFIDWLNEIEATRFNHMGTYNCRKMRGSSVMSEHSFGTAIDISGLNGVSVENDWDDEGPKGMYLTKASKTACKYFGNVITPDDNTLHHDHFHLDNGYRSTCLPDYATMLKRRVIQFLTP
jgi:hypothetical protein